jgi:hypothetical protein
MFTPESRRTLLPATSFETRRRDSVTGAFSCRRHLGDELPGESVGKEGATEGIAPPLGYLKLLPKSRYGVPG